MMIVKRSGKSEGAIKEPYIISPGRDDNSSQGKGKGCCFK
jgi:hypothetical protein